MAGIGIKKRVDATEGPIFKKLFFFVVPLMLTNLLQHLYNVADNIVVGKFSGDPLALAAVGSSGSFNALFVNFAIGIAAGAGAIVARSCGAKDREGISKSTHTALSLAIIMSVLLTVLRGFIASPVLTLMGTKPELMDNALLYVYILVAGTPGMVIYTFGSALLRSVGDSKTPLYAVLSTGALNVGLNFFFVIVCGMSVAGVALATIISKYASAAIVICAIASRRSEAYAFKPSKLCIDFKMLKEMLGIGIPSAIQSTFFSLTNIILLSAVNTFPTVVMSARTIATNIDVLLSTAINTYLHGTMTFTSQNYGARKPDRMKRSLLCAIVQASVIGFVVGQIMIFFYEPLVSMYIASDDPNRAEIFYYAKEIMTIMLSSYFIGAVMESLAGFLRGIGNSFGSMIVSMICVCCFRILWIFFIFPNFGTITGLYLVYPCSFVLAVIGLSAMSAFSFKSIKAKLLQHEKEQENIA